MADVTVKVLEPAESYALLTLDELKVALGIAPADTSQDAQLQLMIDQYSDVIATMCKRVFAKEKVTETWRGDPPTPSVLVRSWCGVWVYDLTRVANR